VIQVAFEGQISKASIQSELAKGNKASGDLIPWAVSQQYNDTDFAGLSGARIVRIATHPDVQKLGYGSRAMDLLISYFQGDLSGGMGTLSVGMFGGESSSGPAEESGEGLTDEDVAPRKKSPPLLTTLSDRPAERLHWIGVSFGLTGELLNFWSKKQMKVCYVRQTSNDITGEHSVVMLRELNCEGIEDAPTPGWLRSYVKDYRKRLISLFAYTFRRLDTSVCLTLVDPSKELSSAGEHTTAVYDERALDASELLGVHLSPHDMARLELYSRNMVDHHMIFDLLPTLARLYFMGRLPTVHLSALQMAILLACGLQHRDADDVTRELDLPANQILAFFNKTVRKISSFLRALIEKDVALQLPSSAAIARMEEKAGGMVSSRTSLREDQQEDETTFRAEQKRLLMSHKDLSRHLVDVEDEVIEQTVAKAAKKHKAIPSSISVEVSSIRDKAVAGQDRDQHKDRHKRKSGGEMGESGGDSHGKHKKKKSKHYDSKE
jgi:N-acetyltransferase 10